MKEFLPFKQDKCKTYLLVIFVDVTVYAESTVIMDDYRRFVIPKLIHKDNNNNLPGTVKQNSKALTFFV